MAEKNSAGRGWTVAAIPNQAGRRVLVTGANSGIGFYTALELARNGAHVLLGARDAARGEAAVARILSEAPGASVELLRLDLASLQDVRGVAEAELARGAGLDLLINNAGVMAPKRRELTADGFEMQFGVNVLGHFALTALLLPALERAAERNVAAPRIVTVASIAHKTGKINFENLQSQRSYRGITAYRQTKLANLMLALEMDRRLRARGSRVMSVAAHPGVAQTPLFVRTEHTGVERLIRQGIGVAIRTFLNSAAEGAVPTLFAATAPEVESGGYYGPQRFVEMGGGDVGLAVIAERARDRTVAARLWSECERLTGVKMLS